MTEKHQVERKSINMFLGTRRPSMSSTYWRTYRVDHERFISPHSFYFFFLWSTKYHVAYSFGMKETEDLFDVILKLIYHV